MYIRERRGEEGKMRIRVRNEQSHREELRETDEKNVSESRERWRTDDDIRDRK